MRYLVAVSGGVDSVVLLHKLVTENVHTLIVAHFDHGIRSDSAADARFVEGLAASYNLPFEGRREELGNQASEALARERRYHFLREMALKHDATIMTAHHMDDIVETIVINMIRGTGWRGLAVLDTHGIIRPQLMVTKQNIYDYALSHQLEWVEDETNGTDLYLRNRIRRRIHGQLSREAAAHLSSLRHDQLELKHAIMHEEKKIIGSISSYSRYFFTHSDEMVAIELLRYLTRQAITHPQAKRALHAIKTAQPGTTSEVGAGVQFTFTSRNFTIQTP